MSVKTGVIVRCPPVEDIWQKTRQNIHMKIRVKLFEKLPQFGFYVKMGAKNAKKFIKGVAFYKCVCYNTFDFFKKGRKENEN